MHGIIIVMIAVVLLAILLGSFFIFARRWHKQDDEISPEHCCAKDESSDGNDIKLAGQPGHGDFEKREVPAHPVITEQELAVSSEVMMQMGRCEL